MQVCRKRIFLLSKLLWYGDSELSIQQNNTLQLSLLYTCEVSLSILWVKVFTSSCLKNKKCDEWIDRQKTCIHACQALQYHLMCIKLKWKRYFSKNFATTAATLCLSYYCNVNILPKQWHLEELLPRTVRVQLLPTVEKTQHFLHELQDTLNKLHVCPSNCIIW